MPPRSLHVYLCACTHTCIFEKCVAVRFDTCVCLCVCVRVFVCVRVCVYARLKRLSEKEEEPEEQVSVKNGWCKRKQISREGYQKTYPVWDACSQGTQSHRGHPSGKMKAVLQG